MASSCCCCCTCASLAFCRTAPTRCWDSKYLDTHRSVHDISPKLISPSLCRREAHLLKQDDEILLKRSWMLMMIYKHRKGEKNKLMRQKKINIYHVFAVGGWKRRAPAPASAPCQERRQTTTTRTHVPCTFPFRSAPHRPDPVLAVLVDLHRRRSS